MYIFMKMNVEHLSQSFADTLSALRPVNLETIKRLGVDNDTYVISDSATYDVVATGKILIEQKYINDGGKVAHVEDVAVRKDMHGKGYGKRLVGNLLKIAEHEKCYKVILDCDFALIDYYRASGFYQLFSVGNMRKDI